MLKFWINSINEFSQQNLTKLSIRVMEILHFVSKYLSQERNLLTFEC